MLIDDMMAYSEVDNILSLMEEEYVNKIPSKVLEFIKREKLEEYSPNIKADIPLTEQNLKRDTMIILAVLNLNYWCESEEEKQEFLDELAKNEKERKELEEKYNPDNIFKKRQEEKNEHAHTEELSVVEYKEPNFIQKLLNKIARLFKK